MSAKSFKDWLSEGELLYSQALSEYQNLEGQLEQLEQTLMAKKNEVNQIAQVIGKSPIESTRRLSAQLVESPENVTTVVGTVTRALTGRGLGRG